MSKSSFEKETGFCLADESLRKLILDENLEAQRNCSWNELKDITILDCMECGERLCRINQVLTTVRRLSFFEIIETGQFERILKEAVKLKG